MGWLAYAETKQQLVNDLTSNPNIKEHSLRGNQLWCLGESENGQTIIQLYLLQKIDGQYGYKGISESMHPYYYNCPQKFLKEAPVASQEWRDKVMELAAKGKQKVGYGDVVTLAEGYKQQNYSVVSTKPLHAIGDDGVRYRIPRKAIETIVGKGK